MTRVENVFDKYMKYLRSIAFSSNYKDNKSTITAIEVKKKTKVINMLMEVQKNTQNLMNEFLLET